VRRDIPRTGQQGRGCWQRWVELKLPVVTERRGFVIYRMNETKEVGRMKVGDDFEGNK